MILEDVYPRIIFVKNNNPTKLNVSSLRDKNYNKLSKAKLLEVINFIVGELKDLQILEFSDCGLTELPIELFQLKRLRQLNLKENSLISLPQEILELKNLQILELDNNRFSEIPQHVNKLKTLTALSLKDNLLSDIPDEMLGMNQLKKLDLRGNQGLLKKVQEEILNDFNNAQKILNYYSKITREPTRPLNEAKIVIVGEANVGKTSLINQLVYEHPEETKSTHGIDIHQWENEINGEKIKLNVWDFGGQEPMHSTHQCFFTKRTIYIVVINARENEDTKLEEWLQRIKSFGGNSPIIVVANKVDENDRNSSQESVGYFDVSQKDLKIKYENIEGFYGVCSDIRKVEDRNKQIKYKKLFDEFRAKLIEVIGKLDGLSKGFPESWFSVKDYLEEMNRRKTPYISKREYIITCLQKRVYKEIDQDTIVEFLNEIGTVIYFGDKNINDTMVFNPQWITNGIYALTDNPNIIRRKGEFLFSDLTKILSEQKYPEDKHTYILDIMRKFKLCIDIESGKRFLIPDVLPKDDTFTIDNDWKDCISFRYQYHTYLKSIFTQFMVDTFKYIHKNIYWRYGLVLERNNCFALIKSDLVDKRIVVLVRGKNKREKQDLLSYIRTSFEKIHATFEDLAVEELVAHPRKYKGKDGKEYEILRPYKRLAALEAVASEANDEAKEFVEEIGQYFMVSDWLDGIEDADKRKSKADKLVSELPGIDIKASLTIQINAATFDIEKMEERFEMLSKRKKLLESQATKSARIKLVTVYFAIILIPMFWILVILSYGWDKMEVWTYILALGYTVLTYLYSAWMLTDSFSLFPKKFSPKVVLNREKKKQFAAYQDDLVAYEQISHNLKKSKNHLTELKREYMVNYKNNSEEYGINQPR